MGLTYLKSQIYMICRNYLASLPDLLLSYSSDQDQHSSSHTTIKRTPHPHLPHHLSSHAPSSHLRPRSETIHVILLLVHANHSFTLKISDENFEQKTFPQASPLLTLKHEICLKHERSMRGIHTDCLRFYFVKS
jgi:hypothetical protein